MGGIVKAVGGLFGLDGGSSELADAQRAQAEQTRRMADQQLQNAQANAQASAQSAQTAATRDAVAQQIAQQQAQAPEAVSIGTLGGGGAGDSTNTVDGIRRKNTRAQYTKQSGINI